MHLNPRAGGTFLRTGFIFVKFSFFYLQLFQVFFVVHQSGLGMTIWFRGKGC